MGNCGSKLWPERCPVPRLSFPNEELLAADEMFVCHTGSKVDPVRKFEDRELPAPGPYTARIAQLLRDITTFKDDRFAHWFQAL